MATETRAALDISGSVPPDYVHDDKEIVPAEGLSLPRARLKWYDIQRPGEPVPAGIAAMARRFLQTEAASGALAIDDQLGFVILHRCGEAFYFLLVSTWRHNQELWETVYYKDAATSGFQRFPRPGTHLGAYCVWELGAVCHEQQAYTRFLRSNRDGEAVQAYLDDQYAGMV